MFELFLNPANVAIGGALMASPILIHLLNRLRYRRVAWAAMEFLLKSEKRARRRLIIEQLLLLALRILLVLLAALLVARFLGFTWAGFQAKNSVHVAILDDRLSMSDHWKGEDGKPITSFQFGKQVLAREISRVLAQARTPGKLIVLLSSDPNSALEYRLGEESLRQMSSDLAKVEHASWRHLDLGPGMEASRATFDRFPDTNHYLHVVSDFRQGHWSEAESVSFRHQLETLSNRRVKINLMDVAHPFRSETQKLPLYHDNLAIVELRPETRVAAEGMPVQFTVTVANYSASERKNVRVTVKVNGVERLEGSVPLPSVPPGRTQGSFQIALTQPGFQEISANLEDEEAGLEADNTRYAVVEVRRQVPVLVIDGDPANGDKPGGDTYHLRALFGSARGYEVIRGGTAELERPRLDQFPSIYLLNVRELNDRARRNLEEYARDGGGVVFFLGDRANTSFYNKLYADGAGLFPAPLADRAVSAPSDDERQQRLARNLAEPHAQLLIRDPNHPIFAEIAASPEYFDYLTVDRYFPVNRRHWDLAAAHAQELATLPNERPVSDYAAAAEDLLRALPVDESRFSRFRPALERARQAIREALTGKSLPGVAVAFQNLLQPPSDTGQNGLAEFWKSPDSSVQSLRERLDRFRQTIQYGDPLVVARTFGRGRCVAFLTTAGRAWNDWAGGSPASVTYPVVMLDLQKYMTGIDRLATQTVGSTIDIEADGTRFEPRMHAWRLSPGQRAGAAVNRAAEESIDLGDHAGNLSGSRLAFMFERTGEPGVYRFDLTSRPDSASAGKPESRAVAVNVDTDHESDLRRAASDDLERFGRVMSPAFGSFTDSIERPSDFSESPWFYLIFLAVLLAEQALAVHLSFHHAEGTTAKAIGQVPRRPVTA
jgi:hypothetical protein